jgi:uncharacterized protein (TIGR03435 family)
MTNGLFVDWRGAVSSAVFASVLLGQAPPVERANAGFEFEAASIRPAAPQPGTFAAGPFGGPGSNDPSRIRGINLTLKALLMRAYNLRYEQIAGPQWIESDHYDLVATVGPGATREQVNRMLQNLLTERFKLIFHHETRDLPVYELVQAKRRSKLKESSPESSLSVGKPRRGDGFLDVGGDRTTGLWSGINPGGRVRVVGRNQPMLELIRELGNQAGRPIVDGTGLHGKYNFVLEYALVPGAIGPLGMPMPRPPTFSLAPYEPETEPPPPLIVALDEQLGLKLNPKKAPLDVLVIDEAQRTPILD